MPPDILASVKLEVGLGDKDERTFTPEDKVHILWHFHYISLKEISATDHGWCRSTSSGWWASAAERSCRAIHDHASPASSAQSATANVSTTSASYQT